MNAIHYLDLLPEHDGGDSVLLVAGGRGDVVVPAPERVHSGRRPANVTSTLIKLGALINSTVYVI